MHFHFRSTYYTHCTDQRSLALVIPFMVVLGMKVDLCRARHRRQHPMKVGSLRLNLLLLKVRAAAPVKVRKDLVSALKRRQVIAADLLYKMEHVEAAIVLVLLLRRLPDHKLRHARVREPLGLRAGRGHRHLRRRGRHLRRRHLLHLRRAASSHRGRRGRAAAASALALLLLQGACDRLVRRGVWLLCWAIEELRLRLDIPSAGSSSCARQVATPGGRLRSGKRGTVARLGELGSKPIQLCSRLRVEDHLALRRRRFRRRRRRLLRRLRRLTLRGCCLGCDFGLLFRRCFAAISAFFLRRRRLLCYSRLTLLRRFLRCDLRPVMQPMTPRPHHHPASARR